MENFIFRAVCLDIDKYISLKVKKEKHMSSIFMKSKKKKKKNKKKKKKKQTKTVYENISYYIYNSFKRIRYT